MLANAITQVAGKRGRALPQPKPLASNFACAGIGTDGMRMVFEDSEGAIFHVTLTPATFRTVALSFPALAGAARLEEAGADHGATSLGDFARMLKALFPDPAGASQQPQQQAAAPL